jgi:signal transduction histidine kinase/PAS domain-containing protein
MANQTESIVDHGETVNAVENQRSSLNQETFEGLIERALQFSTAEKELFGSLAEVLAAQSIGFAIAGIREADDTLVLKALYAPNGTNLSSHVSPPSLESNAPVKLLDGLSEDLYAGRILYMSSIEELVVNCNGVLHEAFRGTPVMITSLQRTNCVNEIMILCGPGLCDKWLTKGEELAERLSTALDILRVKSESSKENKQSTEAADFPKVGLLVADAEGTITDANHRTLELLNCAEDEILGRRIEDVLPQEQDLIHANKTTLRGSTAVIKIVHQDQNDAVRYLHVEHHPVTIEGNQDTLIRLSDLSDRWPQDGTLQSQGDPIVLRSHKVGWSESIPDLGKFRKALVELIHIVNLEKDIHPLLQTTGEYVLTFLELPSCVFSILNPDKNSFTVLHAIARAGSDESLSLPDQGSHFKLDDLPFTTQDIFANQLIRLPETEAHFWGGRKPSDQHPSSPALILPMIAFGEDIGLVVFDLPNPDHELSNDERAFLISCVEQISRAYSGIREANELVEKSRWDQSFHEMVEDILSSLELDQVVQRTLKGVTDLFTCHVACLSCFDLRRKKIHVLGVMGGEEKLEQGRILPLDAWEGSPNLLKGEINHYTSIDALKSDSSIERYYFDQGIQSWLSLPIQSESKDMWILSLGSRQSKAFTTDHLASLGKLQQHLTVALPKTKEFKDIRHRAEVLSALYEFSSDLWSERELMPLLKTSLRWATEILNITMGAVFLVEDGTEEITLVAEQGLPVPPSVLRLAKGQGLAGRIWDKRKPIILQKIRDLGDPRWLEACYATGSAIGVPLFWDGKVRGVITLFNPGKDMHFGHDEARLLGTLAAQMALGIENFQSHERINRRVNQLKVVNDLARRISAILIEDLLFSDIVRRVAHGLNLELVVLFLVKGTELVEAASYYLPADMHGNWEPIRLRIGKDGISGLVASEGEPVVTSNVAKDPNYLSILPIKTQIQSAVGIPLKLKGKVTGVLFTGSHKLAAFDKADVEGLQTLGAHLSTCIENARLYEETKEVQYRLAESEKLRALGLMTGGVAKDFNNMLSIIYAQTKLAIDRIEDATIRNHLDQVITSVESGRKTVRRLSDFAHTRKDTSDFIGIDMNLILREAIELSQSRWQDQARRDGIQIEVISDLYADGYILGAPDELREVFVNVIMNSVEAMPNGGTIAIQTFSKGEGLTITVTDTGVGMTSESKDKVFKPFYTTKPGRAGLGLSMGYGVVQRHGGNMEVLSKAGEGTTIKIWLPISYDVQLENDHPDIVKYPALVEPVTILVVEDEDSIREGLVDTFSNAGHRVLAARNGLEGFERYLEAGKLDVVFTDLGMPKLSGWELIEQLRAFDQNLPIVILSAWADEVDPMKVEQYQVARVLGKPFEMARLHLILEEVLNFGTKQDLTKM